MEGEEKFKQLSRTNMPRGRKRKFQFVPQPWIPNTSSEDEDHHNVHGVHVDVGAAWFPPNLHAQHVARDDDVHGEFFYLNK